MVCVRAHWLQDLVRCIPMFYIVCLALLIIMGGALVLALKDEV